MRIHRPEPASSQDPAEGAAAEHRVSLSKVLSGLTAAQREAVTTDHHPLCVLAGPGSGKTTVLTRRVARRFMDGSAEPRHTLIVTFTRKAASELRQRLEGLGVQRGAWAGTFHAAAYAQLRRIWSDRGERPPALLDDPARLVRTLVSDLGPTGRESGSERRPSPRAGLPSDVVANIVGEIHWARATLVTPDEYAAAARRAGRRVALPLEEVERVFSGYSDLKRRKRLIDLDDLLEIGASALEEDAERAKLQRWQFRHLFVDEFQDLNPAQWRLLRAWIGDGSDLFVVGDPLQAVYGWNGADPSFLERFTDLVPGSLVLHLRDNHRSTPSIVTTARALLEGPGTGWTSPPASRPAGDPLSRLPMGQPPVVTAFDDEESEATAVARWLRRMHRPGRAWSHLAVLARTNARLEPFAESLHRFGIPHRVSSAVPVDDAARAVLSLLRGADPEQPLRIAVAEAVVTLHSPGPAGQRLPEFTALPAEVSRLVEEHACEAPLATVGEFIAWLEANAAGEDLVSAGPDRVQLLTFHKAKGLEWRAVAVVGLEDGTVPITYGATVDSLAEERRLLYVAVTRAEEELWCSWARRRGAGSGTRQAQASRFLEPITRASCPELTCGKEVSRTHLAELRSKLGAAV